MTIVISVLNQKGGVGKTTIAVNLAHAFHIDSYSVLLVDSDPQGSARDWNEENGGNLFPVIGLDRETLPNDLKKIKDSYDIVIIDGAPQIAKMAAAAINISDIVLIPCQPSPYDIWATADLVELVKSKQILNDGIPKAAFLISRAIKNTKLSKEIALVLQEYELPVLESITTQSVIYPTVVTNGGTVFCNSFSLPAKEILKLKDEIKEVYFGS
jgi:chromosome partitioning protein